MTGHLRFTLRQIEYFVATAEAGSITLAAERINVSQPSISTAITQLEAELDAQLFLRRHARSLTLTPTGAALLAEAKGLLDQAQHLYTTASDAVGRLRGTFSLGCLVTFAPMILPELSHSFQTILPGVRIQPDVADHEHLLARLSRAELDAVLSYDLSVPDDYDFRALAELPPCVMVSETDPLAQEVAVTLEEMAAQDMILLDLPLSRDYFMGLFARQGLVPRIVARLTQQDVIRTMVANRYGYTLANVRPRSDMALDGRRVVRVRLAGEHRAMRIGIFTLKSQRRSRLVAAFEDHCSTIISDSYIPGMVSPLMERRQHR